MATDYYLIFKYTIENKCCNPNEIGSHVISSNVNIVVGFDGMKTHLIRDRDLCINGLSEKYQIDKEEIFNLIMWNGDKGFSVYLNDECETCGFVYHINSVDVICSLENGMDHHTITLQERADIEVLIKEYTE